MRKKNLRSLILFTILSGLLSGCIGGGTSKYINPSFRAQDIDLVAILPFMDNRKDPDPDFDFNKFAAHGNRNILVNLKHIRRYRVVLTSDIGNVERYSVEDLPERISNSEDDISSVTINPDSVDPQWIKQLGPSKAEWVIVPVLEDLRHYNVIILAGGTAEISLYLFNKNTAELSLWCTGAFHMSAGILYYGVMKVISSDSDPLELFAVEMATGSCARIFPERQGPYLLTFSQEKNVKPSL